MNNSGSQLQDAIIEATQGKGASVCGKCHGAGSSSTAGGKCSVCCGSGIEPASGKDAASTPARIKMVTK